MPENASNLYYTTPSIEEDNALRGKEKSERKWSNIAKAVLAFAKPALKITSGITMTNAAMTASKGVGLLAMSGPVMIPAAIGVAAGGLAYFIHKSAMSIEPQFNQMMSDNIYKDIGVDSPYEHTGDDVDPIKSYTKAIAKEASRRGSRLTWHKGKALAKGAADIGRLTVDKFFSDQRDRMYVGYAKDDTSARSLFLAHIMGTLENNNDPVAQRIKQEPLFQRESIRAYMEDAGLMVKDMAKALPEIKDVSNMLEASLGQDARFVLDNLKSYSKGKESYFALELDILVHATQQSQIEGVTREFATRLVNTITQGANNGLSKEEAKQEFVRFQEFEHLLGRYDDNPVLTRLATNGVNFAKKAVVSFNKSDARTTRDEINKALKDSGVIRENIHFRSLKKGTAAYERAVDALTKYYLPKDKDIHLSFQEQVVSSMLSVLEKRIKERANKDFPTAEAIAKLDIKKLDMDKIHSPDFDTFKTHLVELREGFSVQSGDNEEKPLALDSLAKKLRLYGVRSLEAATPDDAAKHVYNRIKTRMYYETHKDEMKKGFSRSGLDSHEFGLSP